MTPIKLEKNPAKGPNTIPLTGSKMKIQLYQIPEKGRGALTNESKITLTAAKTATSEINFEPIKRFNHIAPSAWKLWHHVVRRF